MYNPIKSTWMNPNIEYLFNSEIIEYDIKDAGFNIIRQFHLLSDDQIRNLSKMEKNQRIIAIGKLQINNKELSDGLNERFAEIRAQFISANHLTDNDIISVKKDAIFTIGIHEKLKFGKIEFIMKNRYTSYIRFTNNFNIEIYYNDGNIDIKGIGERGVNRHRLYLLDFLNRVIRDIELKNPSLKRYMKRFIGEYKRGELDDGYYLEFNNLSKDADAKYNFQKLVVPVVQIIIKELG